jgi:hypothetical protein
MEMELNKMKKFSIVKILTFGCMFYSALAFVLMAIGISKASANEVNQWQVEIIDSGESVGVYYGDSIKLINSGMIINNDDLICMVNPDIKTKNLLKFNDETVMFDLSCNDNNLVFTPSSAYDYLIASDVMREAYTLDVHSASNELLVSVPMIGYHAASKEAMMNNYWSDQQ